MNSFNYASDNLVFYNSIRPKNLENTYTVIATINEYDTGKLLALATGTQACSRVYEDDIEDCHAESLVKRCYKRYLINTIARLISSSLNLAQANELISNQCSRDLTLFVSQFPCGLVKRYEGEEPVDEETGVVIRRKPGRGTNKDGKIIYVEKDNCTVKLRKWIDKGFQGSKLGSMFNIYCKVKKLIIGNCEPDEEFDYQFWSKKLEKSLCNSSVEIELVSKNIRREEFVFSNERQPQPVAVVWWSDSPQVQFDCRPKHQTIGKHNYEFVVDGRKRGITKEQCLSDNSIFKLKIGNYWLRRDLKSIEDSIKKLALDNSLAS